MLRNEYLKAKKLGEKACKKAEADGEYPYLPALDGLLKDRGRTVEKPLGIQNIPIPLVFGTLTRGRQQAFARNYMPLLDPESEFASKWMNLLDAQIREGIRDAIRVYEFMGKFYVSEGNKRVSVLRYLEQPEIEAEVTRIITPCDESREMRIYEEFLKFYESTGMYEPAFTEEGYYDLLAQFLDMHLDTPWPELVTRRLKSAYAAFERVYLARKGDSLKITRGDAFLIYLKENPFSSLLEETDKEIDRRMAGVWKIFKQRSEEHDGKADTPKAVLKKMVKMVSHMITHRDGVS